MFERTANTPSETAKTAQQLASALPPPPLCIHLQGDLGAGKTLWVRALLRALGGAENVPSPSFALALSYALPSLLVHHLDLFRLPLGKQMPADLLEYLYDDNALCLIEWPERVVDLPPPDVHVKFEFVSDEQRRLIFSAGSDKGMMCLRALTWQNK